MNPAWAEVINSQAPVRLVQGKPGVGKTHLGCNIALHELGNPNSLIKPHQRVLFLTFARNAVARIREVIADKTLVRAGSSKSELVDLDSRGLCQRIRVETFHGFFWWLVSSYGMYIGDSERSNCKPWLIGSVGEAASVTPDGYRPCTYDDLCSEAKLILEIDAIRRLVAEIYPLVIVDEGQDIDPTLLNIIDLLKTNSRIVLLYGPGQCLYGKMKGFLPEEMMTSIRTMLAPELFEITPIYSDKQRFCPQIAQFIECYEQSTKPAVADRWPVRRKYVPKETSVGGRNHLPLIAKRCVLDMMEYLRRQLHITQPSIAVLVSTNRAAAELFYRFRKRQEGKVKLPRISASLTMNDDILLYYGQLIISLLSSHWVSVTTEDVDQTSVQTWMLCLCKALHARKTPTMDELDKASKTVSARTSRMRKPRPDQSCIEKIENDMETIGGELRSSGIVDQTEMYTLRSVAIQFVDWISSLMDHSGQVDIRDAQIQFDRWLQQRIIKEKLGIQPWTQIMTIHRSKGREFDGVIVVFEDSYDAAWRAGRSIPEKEVRDLYRVALSRARHALALIAFDDAHKHAAEPLRPLLR